MYCFLNLEPVCCSMSGSNCCFLTCIQFATVCCDPHKVFGVVNKAEVDVFLELSCFFDYPTDTWSLVPLPFLNPAWTSGSSWFMYCWSLSWGIWSITLLACGMSAVVPVFERSLALPFFGIGMKTDLSSPVGIAEFSIFAGILSAALSQHHLSGFEIAQLEFHHLH